MNEHKTGNGHTQAELHEASIPVDWPPEPPRPWWRAMSRPMRAVAGEVETRDSTILQRWLPLVTFLALQGGIAIWAFSHVNTLVEQHDKVLSTSSMAEMIAANGMLKQRLDDLTMKYNKQQEYIDVITLYEQKIRELMVSTGRFRSVEIPPPPQRPRD